MFQVVLTDHYLKKTGWILPQLSSIDLTSAEAPFAGPQFSYGIKKGCFYEPPDVLAK